MQARRTLASDGCRLDRGALVRLGKQGERAVCREGDIVDRVPSTEQDAADVERSAAGSSQHSRTLVRAQCIEKEIPRWQRVRLSVVHRRPFDRDALRGSRTESLRSGPARRGASVDFYSTLRDSLSETRQAAGARTSQSMT